MSYHLQSKIKDLKSELGQGLVESALVFGLLMLIVVGVVDFTYIFQAYVGVVNAADVGATYGATSPAAAYNQAAIASEALAETNNWRCMNTIVSSSTGTDAYGYLQVSVTVSCQVADLIVIPDSLDNVWVSSTAVWRVYQ